MVKVKICGITCLADAELAVELGASALGFIFYKKSPRYLSPANAKKIIAQLPPFVTSVGVFVNEKKAVVERIARQCGLNVLQFHGDESPAYCRAFKGIKTIKAFRIGPDFKFSDVAKYDTDAYLFDAFTVKAFGGTGVRFNWDVLKGRTFSKPLILSGGLNPGNIQEAVSKVRPYAVDVSSGVEAAPGKKDERLLVQLFKVL